MHEAQLHAANAFVTLTYSENPVSLCYRDFQLFMKRLRKVFPGARFYMCGEYGEINSRPHFHAILFGVDFVDKYYWRNRRGHRCYRSAVLERLWPHGNAEIGNVTFESAAYVARYIMKKVTGDAAEEHYRVVDPDTGEVIDRVPEFCHMSLKPGIGAGWLGKFFSDVFPTGEMVVRGVETLSPRYYDKVYRRVDRIGFDAMKSKRMWKALDKPFSQRKDSLLDDRLAVREHVTVARALRLARKGV